MGEEMSEEVRAIFKRAQKRPLVDATLRGGQPSLDRTAIESRLPHRDPFLLVSSVTVLDREAGLIAARYDLAQAVDVLAGHFPGHPVWPGVLQIEAIGQAGIIVHLAREGGAAPEQVALTHVQGARFMRPVTPGGDLEVVAQVLEDGLFFTIVGQCIQGGEICSIAALSGL